MQTAIHRGLKPVRSRMIPSAKRPMGRTAKNPKKTQSSQSINIGALTISKHRNVEYYDTAARSRGASTTCAGCRLSGRGTEVRFSAGADAVLPPVEAPEQSQPKSGMSASTVEPECGCSVWLGNRPQHPAQSRHRSVSCAAADFGEQRRVSPGMGQARFVKIEFGSIPGAGPGRRGRVRSGAAISVHASTPAVPTLSTNG